MVCLMVLFNEIILYLYGFLFRPDRGKKIVRSVHIRGYIYTQSERFTIRNRTPYTPKTESIRIRYIEID